MFAAVAFLITSLMLLISVLINLIFRMFAKEDRRHYGALLDVWDRLYQAQKRNVAREMAKILRTRVSSARENAHYQVDNGTMEGVEKCFPFALAMEEMVDKLEDSVNK